MQLIPFSEKDFLSLRDFMYPLWHETYDPILPKAQVDFLIDKYFLYENIKAWQEKGYVYRKIDNVGVLVYVDKGDCIYIDKLYLVQAARGKNYPTLVFEELSKCNKDLVLNVNRSNARAVNCYLKNGFFVESEQEIRLSDTMATATT